MLQISNGDSARVAVLFADAPFAQELSSSLLHAVAAVHSRPDPRMKLAILSRNSKLYSTRRLVEAARAQGHTARVLDPLRCYMRIASDGFDMHYKGRPLAGYQAVLPRIGASITRYGSAVLHQFELMGSYTPNPADAIARARDKLRAHQLLAAQGIGMPTTVFGDNPDDCCRCSVRRRT
jgi:ribosomal protein S6--L-glutamate ligase